MALQSSAAGVVISPRGQRGRPYGKCRGEGLERWVSPTASADENRGSLRRRAADKRRGREMVQNREKLRRWGETGDGIKDGRNEMIWTVRQQGRLRRVGDHRRRGIKGDMKTSTSVAGGRDCQSTHSYSRPRTPSVGHRHTRIYGQTARTDTGERSPGSGVGVK